MKKFLTMLKIKSRIALRGIDGVFFGVAMPVGVALLIGMIAGNKPAFAGAEYTFLESTFPAFAGRLNPQTFSVPWFIFLWYFCPEPQFPLKFCLRGFRRRQL